MAPVLSPIFQPAMPVGGPSFEQRDLHREPVRRWPVCYPGQQVCQPWLGQLARRPRFQQVEQLSLVGVQLAHASRSSPPSTLSTLPVIAAARSLQRKSTAHATSSGRV